MELIWQGLVEAVRLILSGVPAVLQITWLSIKLGERHASESPNRGPIGRCPRPHPLSRSWSHDRALVNTGMGLPPVVVGLFVSVFLWRSGPLGILELLYTPTAIVIAQFVIAAPIVTGLTVAAMQQLNMRLRLQLIALGASRWQMLWLLTRKARLPLLAAVMTGFGGVISEVGASMMVGGNLLGQTRVLTTAHQYPAPAQMRERWQTVQQLLI